MTSPTSTQAQTCAIRLGLSHSFAEQLPNSYQTCQPRSIAQPELLYFNHALAQQLGMDLSDLDQALLAGLMSGSVLSADARPLAQAYSGHQFGHLSPQLGDGRAHLLGELQTPTGERVDLALKGSGRTPYSRNGDGLAALGPMLREVIISEAMAALGVPSTRSLAVVGTGETLYRQQVEPGAVLARTAASHLRVGSLQFLALRQQSQELSKMVDYCLARHYPDQPCPQGTSPALHLLKLVMHRQIALIAQWYKYGFIHGVMNTDNMTLSGETIDYGPCAFLEAYNPEQVFSSIDQDGRYAYGNQAAIGQWNLARMAEALLALIAPEQDQAIALATELLQQYWPQWQQAWRQAMGEKLGLSQALPEDEQLIQDWLKLLEQQQIDFHLAFRALSSHLRGQEQELNKLFRQPEHLNAWLARWHERLQAEQLPDAQLAARLDQHNPYLIARNHQVERALSAARQGDLSPFERLLQALQLPFADQPEYEDLRQPADPRVTRQYQTFCGT